MSSLKLYDISLSWLSTFPEILSSHICKVLNQWVGDNNIKRSKDYQFHWMDAMTDDIFSQELVLWIIISKCLLSISMLMFLVTGRLLSIAFFLFIYQEFFLVVPDNALQSKVLRRARLYLCSLFLFYFCWYSCWYLFWAVFQKIHSPSVLTFNNLTVYFL